MSTYTQVHLSARERAEVERSAIEAAHLDVPLELSPHNLARYLTPPKNSIFPLEYSFYLLGDLSGKTVLDYGCGPGEDTVILASKGASVVGIDISPDLIEVARKRAAINNLQIDFRVASAYQTGLPDNSVDVVFAHANLHHLDLDLARREVLRVLKPDGTLVVQEPVRDSRTYAFLRKLVPFTRHDVPEFEAPLKHEQLDAFCAGLNCESKKRFRLPFVPVAQLFSYPNRFARLAFRIDRWLLDSLPTLRRYATSEVRKLNRARG